MPGRGPAGQRINDPLAPFFQSFSTVMEAPPGVHPNRQSFPPNADHNHEPGTPTGHGSGRGTPPRGEAPTFGSARHTITATTRLWPRDGSNVRPPVAPVDHLQG